MRETYVLIAMFAASVMFGGCQSVPGVFNGLGEDPMTMLLIYRTDGQPITQEQYDLVVAIAQRVSAQVGLQLSSPLEAAVSSGVPFGLAGTAAGFIESGVTAGVAGTGAAIAGVIGGLGTFSYANVWAIGDFTETTLRDMEKTGDKRVDRLHVSSAFTRTGNTVDKSSRGLTEK